MTRPSASDLVAALQEMPGDAAAYAAEQERVRARLDRSLAAIGALPTAGNASQQASPLGETALLQGTRAARQVAAAWLVPAFLAGTLAGVAADRLWANQTANGKAMAIASTGRSAAPPSVPSVPATPAPLTVEPKPSTSVATVPEQMPSASTEPARSGSPDPGSTLDAEQRLLDVARTALARGEPAGGIPALQRHAARFPKGQLAEEREALWIRILVAAERDDEATARIASFRRRFPESLFAPVVDNAATTISRRQGGGEPKP